MHLTRCDDKFRAPPLLSIARARRAGPAAGALKKIFLLHERRLRERNLLLKFGLEQCSALAAVLSAIQVGAQRKEGWEDEMFASFPLETSRNTG